MLDTSTKKLLKKIPSTLPSYAMSRMNAYREGKRKYHPIRMIMMVLGINLVPITILLFSVALMGDYKEKLVSLELELLITKTELYSKSIDIPENLDSDIKLIDVDNLQANNQIIVISKDNKVIASTKEIQTFSYSEPTTLFKRIVKNFTDSMLFMTDINYSAPALPIIDADNITDFPGVKDSQSGLHNIATWSLRKETLVFTSTAPIDGSDNIILVVHHAKTLANDLEKFQEDIFRVFISILMLSAALSLYLVGNIANPLRKLARAAETIHLKSGTNEIGIPDMSDRGDEIGELSIALSAMVETLWERMQTIEAFAADVSHELKNPITSIKSAIETLPKVKNKKDEKQLLKILEFDVERLDRLITDISKSTRLDVELSQTKAEVINVHDFLVDILDIYKTNPIRKDLNIDIYITESHPAYIYILGNKEKLTQVLTNLIDNALSFSKKDQKISINIDHDIHHVHLSLNDMGGGISEGTLDKIFNRFYSNRPKKEGEQHHSGLGLSIVKQIMKAHDGTITADNITDDKDKVIGASFSITLPLHHKD